MYRSFAFAFKGIVHLFRKENNAQFHLLAAFVVTGLGIYFDIEKWEWALIVLSVFFVFSAEAFNTAIEKICDKFHPDYSPIIGKVKDLAAAGVLFAAISALVIGVLIFGGRIIQLL